jgi:NAD(P)-dependent dehydrogenase (short-subunit alcohol dehydrogenase family)
MDLNQRNVVVTGASGALGGAVVAALRARGATVFAPTFEREVPASLMSAGIITTPSVDLGDEAAVARFFSGVPSLWASIHLVGGFTMAPIAETRLADLDKMLSINTRSCFLACREAVIAMRRAGGGAGGRIVNVVARPALVPSAGAGMVAYAASKAAVASITQSLAAEVVGEGIFVNAVAPSIIDTPANRASMPDADHARWPKPEDLARAIAQLASPDNRLISGALVPLYGLA